MPEEIVVVGAGGFGRETLDVIEAINAGNGTHAWTVVGVADDEPSDTNLERLAARGYAYLGPLDAVREGDDARRYVIGVGTPEARARIADAFADAGWEAPALIHPTARIGSAVTVGDGTIVCAGVQVSTNTQLARHVHLNPGAIIGHDGMLEDYVSVNPRAVVSGDVRVGARSLIGAAAVVLQGLTVGEGATVGAAACVTRSVAPGRTVVGIPARPLLKGVRA